MRLARTALIITIFLMGTAHLQAQIAHSPGFGTGCDQGCSGCDSCLGTPGCGCNTCCGDSGALSSLCAKVHGAVGCLLGSHVGCDGRHRVYKAALSRNTFDKKFLLPLPYYGHILPCYRHDRCCTGCGATVPNAGCQTCGPNAGYGQEIIEMPAAPMGEPTPAMAPQASQQPPQPSQDRVASTDKPRSMSLRNFIGLPQRTKKTNPQIRQVSAVQTSTQSSAANPLR